MKPQNLLLNCVLATSQLKEHRTTLLILCGKPHVGGLWRDWVNLREEGD